MSSISASILESVKKNLGIQADYLAFDPDIIMHINTTLSVLNQLGIGPAAGFVIEDDTATWTDFLNDSAPLNLVKTYIYLQVRMYFDPPATSFAIEAMERQIEQLTWRISTYREFALAADTAAVVVIDGGAP